MAVFGLGTLPGLFLTALASRRFVALTATRAARRVAGSVLVVSAIVTLLGRERDEKVKLTDYAGLASKRPGLAALLSLFLLSLAGVPGTAGFAGKFFIFRSAVESNHTGLAIIGVLTTVVSFYYYLYVIVQMYMRDPGEDFSDARVTPALVIALLVAATGTVYLGILPGKLLEWTSASALHLLN